MTMLRDELAFILNFLLRMTADSARLYVLRFDCFGTLGYSDFLLHLRDTSRTWTKQRRPLYAFSIMSPPTAPQLRSLGFSVVYQLKTTERPIADGWEDVYEARIGTCTMCLVEGVARDAAQGDSVCHRLELVLSGSEDIDDLEARVVALGQASSGDLATIPSRAARAAQPIAFRHLQFANVRDLAWDDLALDSVLFRQPRDWHLKAKIDGRRCMFLYVAGAEVIHRLFLGDASTAVLPVQAPTEFTFAVDGELCADGGFHPFDVPHYGGDITTHTLSERLAHLPAICSQLPVPCTVPVWDVFDAGAQASRGLAAPAIYRAFLEWLADRVTASLPPGCDGRILIPGDTPAGSSDPYTHYINALKIKPPHECTVDLAVIDGRAYARRGPPAWRLTQPLTTSRLRPPRDWAVFQIPVQIPPDARDGEVWSFTANGAAVGPRPSKFFRPNSYEQCVAVVSQALVPFNRHNLLTAMQDLRLLVLLARAARGSRARTVGFTGWREAFLCVRICLSPPEAEPDMLIAASFADLEAIDNRKLPMRAAVLCLNGPPAAGHKLKTLSVVWVNEDALDAASKPSAACVALCRRK